MVARRGSSWHGDTQFRGREARADRHINGQLMSVWIDVDQKFGNSEGELAVEVEGQGNVKAMFRNMWLKTLP
jgi:hypothetical protein